MKIYHTETQVDYDALMVELDRQGCKWESGDKTTELTKNWKRKSSETCVRVDKKVVTYDKKSYYTRVYPDFPITKYKAKADEKMRFTKENVEKVIDEYFWQADLEPCGDLIAEIHNLDDTPEKVVVQKFVAEFYEECANATLEFLITQLEASDSRSELGGWYSSCSGRHRNGRANAQEVIAKMKLYGYEVKEEPLYHVATKDGKLMLFKYENVVSVTPAPEVMTIKDYGHKPYYQLTEAEIKNYDERYIPFMIPVDGGIKIEEEDE